MVEGEPAAGDLVAVNDLRGHFLASGTFNPHSQIRARLLSWDAHEALDEAFWYGRLQRALEGRAALASATETNAYRLVFAEADGLPGLIVDRYAEYLVLQSLTAGIERRKEMLVGMLAELLQPLGIIERSDVAVRRKEGLQEESGLLWGEAPPQTMLIRENGHEFFVNLWQGQKTGFYLDQRENRALIGEKARLAGKELLNVFAYTGGFSVYAAAAGAAAINHIDSSIPALELAERNVLHQDAARPADALYRRGRLRRAALPAREGARY